MKRILLFGLLLQFAVVSAQKSFFQNQKSQTSQSSSSSYSRDLTFSSDTIKKKSKLSGSIFGNKAISVENNQSSQGNDIRDEWLKRGGKVYYVSVMLTGTYISMDMDKVGTMSGYGGGYSFFLNMIDLKMPQYTTGPSKWSSFNLGFGYDLVVYGFKYKMPPMSGVTVDMNSVYMNIMFTGNFGYTWGFGKYIDEATWRGVALTLKYKPSYNLSIVTSTVTTKMPPTPPIFPNGYTQVTSDSQTSGSFNAGGFGFDIDFNKFSATAAKLAPRPRTKFSFFMLPPVGDNPLFVSASLGVLFYPKQGGFAKR